nr:hypothetical protein [Tanacetum cinerariifolium]
MPSSINFQPAVEVIEFGDSYKAPLEETGKGPASESSAKKKGRTLRFSKYETAKELWEAILKTFGGNEATKKTKNNQLKQQYGNFKAEGSKTLEQTFNRLQAIVSHIEFMDVEIKQDDLNQKFLISLAPEWLMYTIVWRIKDDLDTMSLDYLYNHLKVYEPEVQKKSESNSQNMAFISSSNTSSGKAASLSHDTVCAYIATQSNGSQIKYKDITQIDEDDIEEMDIKWNMTLLSMRADRAPRSQDKGKRESYKQGPKEEETAPKALMALDGIGVIWLMRKKTMLLKNTENLNTKISKLNVELSDCESDLHNYKRGLSQVEARLVEFKEHEVKFYERIRGLEKDVEIRENKIEYLKNELE